MVRPTWVVLAILVQNVTVEKKRAKLPARLFTPISALSEKSFGWCTCAWVS